MRIVKKTFKIKYKKSIQCNYCENQAVNLKNETAELEAFHRKQPRPNQSIFYPKIISNEDLYERTNTHTRRN
jgi:predicted methyltransferase